jgi:hypothetical protein
MTKVYIQPLPELPEPPMSVSHLELLAELPQATLLRITRGGSGLLLEISGQQLICLADDESALWIIKTLNYLGIPVAASLNTAS